MILVDLVNLLHFFVVFFPVLIYFVNKKYLEGWYPFMVWVCLMVPLHWKLLDNKCAASIVTEKLGDLKDSDTNSPFSEKYLKWLYKPLMDYVFKLEWNSDGIEKMLHIHWIVNFTLLWYYTFYKYLAFKSL